jgi:DNA-binding MarR family transcriptional regulator
MLDKKQYEVLSEFRCQLAGFLRFSESAAREAGLTPAQYLLLLHLCGFPDRDWATIVELADRLQASHQSTAALVKRCEAQGWVKKRAGRGDARFVEVAPMPKARRAVARVASHHAEELAQLGAVFDAATRVAAMDRSNEKKGRKP